MTGFPTRSEFHYFKDEKSFIIYPPSCHFNPLSLSYFKECLITIQYNSGPYGLFGHKTTFLYIFFWVPQKKEF